MSLIFVDVEARGRSPVRGTLGEFGAVHERSSTTFHGRLYECTPDPVTPAIPVIGKKLATHKEVAVAFLKWIKKVDGNDKHTFVSDNPAYDYMWIAALFDEADMDNPFGHSGRRLGDYWAGLNAKWSDTQKWKSFRVTPHDHNPVNDCLGNVEAYRRMREYEREVLLDRVFAQERKELEAQGFKTV